MKLTKHVPLWRYEVTRSATDCDGSHQSDRVFVSHKDPNQIVFGHADLFAPGGASSAALHANSTRDQGWAVIGHGTDEGGVGWDYSWTRVTDREVLDTYLKEVEEGSHAVPDSVMERLVRERSLSLVREVFPEATSIGVNPAPQRGGLWSVTEVYGGEGHFPVPLWEGEVADCPLSAATVKTISHDLEILFQDQIVDSGSHVRLY